MIALLRGRIAWLEDDALVVEVQGVGYRVYCPTRLLARLEPGQAVELRIDSVTREDGTFLYGFADAAELAWFRRLRQVQGVGARLALSLLSVLDSERLHTAIAARDSASLTRAAGVGPRLARRILAELEPQLAQLPRGAAPAVAGTPAGTAGGVVEDALSALVHLGYDRSEAWRAIAAARQRLGRDEPPLEELVREALRELAP